MAIPLAVLLIASILGTAVSAAAATASVARFSPRGAVKQVRQVTARFSEPMVPLGDPRDTSMPFDIDCPAHGSARWIDSRNWSFDFDHDLPAGLRCNFKLRAGLKTLAGKDFSGIRTFSFDTGGPSISETRPWSGASGIDEQQAFVLVLDSDADETSVLEHAGFSVEGIPERISVTIVAGADRDLLLKRFQRVTAKQPVIILQAKQRFPNNTAVTLVWGKGIKSKTGIANDQDQTFSYTTRKVFEAKLQCERESPKAGCIPLTPLIVSFTGEISAAQAKQIALISPDGQRQFVKLTDPSDVSSVTFKGPFTESSQYKIELPSRLADDTGRALANQSRFPMTVEMGEYPPLAKFSARFGIIEQADPILPVTVRNLEAQIAGASLKLGDSSSGSSTIRNLISRLEATLWRVPEPSSENVLSWLKRVAEAKRAASVFSQQPAASAQAFTMPKPNGAQAFEVMGIPLRRPGLYIVELKSARLGSVLLGQPKPMYVPTAALVTNLAVHFKQGHDNSIVWVTELESARPVHGARVSITDCHGTELWSGVTDRRGLATVPKLAAFDNLTHCDSAQGEQDSDYYSNQVESIRELSHGVLVTARHGDDFSFVHSTWQQGIESWRFHLPTDYQPSPYEAHTVFDRTLLRAGETVHMKHFIRAKTMSGLSPVSPNEQPNRLTITFADSDQHYDFGLKWSGAGAAASDWQIPREARLGEYTVTMSRRNTSPTPASDSYDSSNQSLTTGSFRVEEFRIPVMKAAIRVPSQPLVAVTEFPLDLSAQYLSGGAAKGLPVTLRSQIVKDWIPRFPDFDDFSFANGVVKTGIVRNDYSEEPAEPPPPGVHQRKDLVLDAAGGARTDISDLPRLPTPVQVHAELEYRDPNGESQTVSNNIVVWPAKLLAGIQVEDWASSPGQIRAHFMVVNDAGKPAAHVPVHVDIFGRTRYAYRKRLIGGFYAYENIVETKAAGALCSGATDDRGRLNCEVKPPLRGEAILQATVTDDAGNSSSATSEIYIPGNDRESFAGRDDDRIDVLPEKPGYEPGDQARFQVRMPFAAATALVTVEREGILAASIVHLSGRDPVLTLPVRDYAPNVFVSVLAVRGRIAGVQPTAMIDLGKPAFKLGIAEIRVGWRDHRLKVDVAPEKTVYHVRDKALVKIAVRTSDGKAPAPGSAIAIAAVDEGLLELRANDSWKLLDAMMDRRSYQIETSTAETQVVGKRHFGLKAIPPGGGGGRQVTRELFDTLLLWKASVPLDSSGNASVEVPLNDSLTSFRIVAIAAAGADQFGTGAATIRSTQDLMLLSGVSPIIRNGDSFTAEFTVRNASEHPFDASINASIDGLASPAQPPFKVALAPGEGRSITWNVAAPQTVRELKYHVDASVENGPSDRLLIAQRVIPAVPVRTFQATFAQLDKPLEQPIARPADALAGEGGVQVALSPSLAASLDGVRDWMREYPYSCLEQRVSRAVALGDPKLWSAIIADLPSYIDSDGLLKYFPNMPRGSEVLTAYVVSIAHAGGLTIPPDSETTITNGLRAFVEGKNAFAGPILAADLPLRKLAAIDALASAGKADPKLLASVTIEPNLWPDSAVIDWWSIVLRLPQLKDRDRRLNEIEQVMRSRLNQQGTAMHLASDARNHMWWLMVSPDRNMVRLAVLLLDNNLWHDDLPLLLRGAIALQSRGAWPETITNAWGTVAVNKFARAFESAPVAGVTTASMLAAAQKLDWVHDPQGGTLSFEWPAAQANLKLEHSGSGNPWAEVRALAAIPLSQPFSSGYRITRTLTPVEAGRSAGWKRGELVRVQLKIEAQTAMTWVVVNDPIPAGASHVGAGLGRDSQIAASGENQTNDTYVWPAFTERAFDGLRAYYDYVPKGSFDIEYTIRLNQAGTFNLPATRVEAIYQPEMLGELPNAPFEVAP
ncbi:MAG: MG2 domain-containing protein [Candidatus Binatus sp.]|uniref:alpha-2-macroglobulin family protein n=1 Tax=Candidatus Binatus sp. TaxID=2811406 RepID=UPI0027162669|nr:MG2 domain-containing protein [Candidatus Binatus sp.]MDO8431521.1 MG2 domain-containing protein [Candidatus Binatus sp.]